jgi:hypothetical protein
VLGPEEVLALPAGLTAVGFSPKGPDNRCGKLEEFQRYAKIVCLHGDAVENKNLPESLAAWRRCTLDLNRRRKVEATQRANAADHQRAMDARRQLREMGVDPDRPSYE